MVAVARLPGPSRPLPQRTSSWVRIGPLTTMTCDGLLVVAQLVQQLAAGAVRARTAATTVARCSGRHPAITALMATCSAVTVADQLATDPTTSSGSSLACSRNDVTTSGVGGTIGRPSVQPRRW